MQQNKGPLVFVKRGEWFLLSIPKERGMIYYKIEIS